jgi:hypothetical protein
MVPRPAPPDASEILDGYTAGDAECMGGETCMAETVGLGGFAQAAAPTLQASQGGSFEQMIAMNEEMYEITVGEHPEFTIPALGFRGTPTAIGLLRVVESGITPVSDSGVAGKSGGQIGCRSPARAHVRFSEGRGHLSSQRCWCRAVIFACRVKLPDGGGIACRSSNEPCARSRRVR